MKKDVFTYIIGGKAGQGTKKAGIAAANFFTDLKREVFQMNDYPSLIRGGHNFSAVSTSTSKIYSHYMKADLVVALDQRSYDIHKGHVSKNGLMVYNSDKSKGVDVGIPISSEAKKYENSDLIEGVSGISVLIAMVGFDKKKLDEIIKKEYGRNVEDNLKFAHAIFDIATEKIKNKVALNQGDKKFVLLSGSEAIGLGAAAAGLDIYFAYPMTPSTPVLHFFAGNGKKLGVVSVQPENEIAVANMAIGASFTGARSMVGTSGGGFCLMQEAFSLAGMVEAPVLFYVGQRPGPSTGVPTYTEQGELLFSLNPGQGEFPRIVASPGNIEEAFYLTAELLNLVWRFQTPAILLSEKHLGESSMSVTLHPHKAKWAEPVLHKGGQYKRYRYTKDGISPLLFPPSDMLIKWNSYEHDELGLTTEEADLVAKMHDKRLRKQKSLVNHLKKMHTVNIFGEAEPLIFTFGSTTMSVLEALGYGDLNMTVVQPIYLKPFPVWELEIFKGKSAIVVEQNSTGQLASLLREKAGIVAGASILKYDGRPFNPIDLANRIKKVVKVEC
ncbi:MAG: 2-oxoacid:acceptor oxidoreductase subunit alpha [Methanocellales archaeon]|nr:2-oxoacid:acceptor oxidoreductase subunit alpha [Methanocellales archaeon]MDD3292138.1 2-oxoacid:acceptor oxidoreductase subunit alpha [Methanocellales archaeon]MDD5235375.1 2-oxoacid:acceptor oxidoreductase subunit alpha [Methanocellales archaeon]MDD5485677.1 2-oxoacid:acceptor oxidoreductase subunit alpha [Methanocellales archaeon]